MYRNLQASWCIKLLMNYEQQISAYNVDVKLAANKMKSSFLLLVNEHFLLQLFRHTFFPRKYVISRIISIADIIITHSSIKHTDIIYMS